jgi:rRNA-processing protein FCF1
MINTPFEENKMRQNTSIRMVADTSFLMESKSKECIENELVHIMESTGRKIAIPRRVIIELESLQFSTDKERASKSLVTLKMIEKHIENWFDFFGEENEATYADHLFNSVFLRHFVSKHLILLTQDRKLAHDITLLNDFQSFRYFKTLAVRIFPNSCHLATWKKKPNDKMFYRLKRRLFQCPHCSWQANFDDGLLSFLQRCRSTTNISLCPRCGKR